MKSLQERMNESKRLRIRYPDRYPVICDRANKSSPEIDRTKYLVPDSLTVLQFIYVIRKRLCLGQEQALYFFVGEKKDLVPHSELMSTIFTNYVSEDGFLYIYYSSENTFGN